MSAWSRAAALLPLLALYLAPRLWLLLATDGSYIDEYKHLISSLELFDSGRFARIYATDVSYRGAHMTIWAGLWMWLFGKSLAVAKLSALALGAASFTLYAGVARRAFGRRSVAVLFCLLYALSPWLIFNSLYVRMYVVYELFLAALVWLTWQAISAFEAEVAPEARQRKQERRGYLALAAIVALNVFNLLLSRDAGQFSLLAATALVFGYLFLFRVRYFSAVLAGLGARVLERRSAARLALIAAAAVAVLSLVDLRGSVKFLLEGKLAWGAPVPGFYRGFFFDANAVATTLFAFGLASLLFSRETFWRAVLPAAGALFALHLATAGEAHILRAVIYFLPLYLLVACYGLDRISSFGSSASGGARPSAAPRGRRAWVLVLCFGAALVTATVRQTPGGFFAAPSVPGEVNYVDYAAAFDTVRERCGGKVIVDASPGVHVSAFHGIRPDFVLVAPGKTGGPRQLYRRDGDARTSVYGGVPVIDDLGRAGSPELCLLVRQPSRWKFITRELEKELEAQAEEVVGLANIKVYIFSGSVLAQR